ncbi:RNA polymerase sigma factor [Dyadobacter tibetensis]|uniref:RNA polymerase sigma factor n=1 Tax=Dyadobacter tibetensis TaxID=1211851 RepID=UPI00046F0275|nr:sigma-70 family RNA polymerase sigma factor [Dyadobacter tibetensis]
METTKIAIEYGAEDPLWQSLKAGDSAAFGRIFHENYRPLFNYGCRINKDQEEVKDCIQLLFLKIWESRERLGASDNIRNYLYSSLRRLIIKRMRSDSNLFVEIDQASVAFHADLSIESTFIQDETSKQDILSLQTALEKLPARQKEALFLKYYGGHSFPDISQIMGISTRAVYKLIYKGLDSLQAELKPKVRQIPHLLSLLF